MFLWSDSVFVNKVLFKRNCAHLFTYCAVTVELNSCERDQDGLVATVTIWPTKPKIFTIWPFTKSLPAPALLHKSKNVVIITSVVT